MKFEKIAVTGGSGRLGRYVVEELRGHCDVTIVDLVPPEERIAFHKCDILKPGELKKALAGQDAVVHLAGLDLVQAATPDAFVHVNAVGTWNVLQAAQHAGTKRVVQCSSVTATGLNESREDFMPKYLPVDEMHPLAPVHPYGVSKLLQEEIARSFNHLNGLQVISLRLMLVIFDAANIALVHERLQDPENRWLYYYISPQDAARAFHCALVADELPFDTMFITAQDTCHEAATLTWFSEKFGSLPEVRNPGIYERNPRTSIFSGARARDILDFQSQDDWISTCQACATSH